MTPAGGVTCTKRPYPPPEARLDGRATRRQGGGCARRGGAGILGRRQDRGVGRAVARRATAAVAAWPWAVAPARHATNRLVGSRARCSLRVLQGADGRR